MADNDAKVIAISTYTIVFTMLLKLKESGVLSSSGIAEVFDDALLSLEKGQRGALLDGARALVETTLDALLGSSPKPPPRRGSSPE